MTSQEISLAGDRAAESRSDLYVGSLTVDQYAVLLRASDAGAGQRELLRFLNERKLLAAIVSDPRHFDLRQSIQLSFAAFREDLDFDQTLIDEVACADTSFVGGVDKVLRILDILELTCCKDLLMDCLASIKNPEGRIGSKVALIIGRVTLDPDRFRNLMKDADPRVRANLVEGVSRNWPPIVQALLRESSNDPHHRVAGNAALALYRLGDGLSISKIFAFLRDDREMHVRAGLWVVCQARDIRFEQSVVDLMNRPEPEIAAAASRTAVLLACEREKFMFAGGVEVAISQVGEHSPPSRFIRFHCVHLASHQYLSPPDFGALNFILKEDSVVVEHYSLLPVPPTEPLLVMAIVSRMSCGLANQLRNCWQNAGEDQGLSIVSTDEGDHLKEIRFSRTFDNASPFGEIEAASAPSSILARCLDALGAGNGRKHCLLALDPSFDETPSIDFARRANNAGVTFHVFATNGVSKQAAESFHTLTAITGGLFVEGASAVQLSEHLLFLRAQHSGSLELSWEPQASPSSSQLALAYCGEFGFGSATIRFP